MKKKLMAAAVAMSVLLPPAGMAQTVKEDLSNAAGQVAEKVAGDADNVEDGTVKLSEEVGGKAADTVRNGLDKTKKECRRAGKETFGKARKFDKEARSLDNKVEKSARGLERRLEKGAVRADSLMFRKSDRRMSAPDAARKAERHAGQPDTLRITRVRVAAPDK